MPKIILSNASDPKSYITDAELHEVHKAKNPAFSFRPSDDVWVLDVHSRDSIKMDWLHHSQGTPDKKQALLRLLVDCAKKITPLTLLNYISGLENSGQAVFGSLSAFEQVWPRMTPSMQTKISSVLSRAPRLGIAEFDELIAFIEGAGVQNSKRMSLDIRKGMYSSVEEESIAYALRTATVHELASIRVKSVPTPTDVNQLGLLLAHHLQRGILRRPTQLSALKWDDIRPSGVPFSQDVISPELAEEGVFHLRTFKGKTGDFRGYAEKRSHRLEPELSSLVAIYHRHYWQTFTANLARQDIKLSDDELRHLRKRSPIFPQLKWFNEQFPDKSKVLKSVSMKSKAFHVEFGALVKNLKNYSKSKFSPYYRVTVFPVMN